MSPARYVVLPKNVATVLVTVVLAVSLSALGVAWGLASQASAATVPDSYSIWSSAIVPRVDADPETSAVQLGVRFSTSQSGDIRSIRYYKSVANLGPHRGVLYGPRGDVLGRVTFAGESAKGWQQADFDAPVPVTAGQTYVAAYFAPQGRYADDVSSLSPSQPASRYALTATQGVYSYGTGMPGLSWNASNYYVDVVFSPGAAAAPPTTTASPPPVTTTTTTTRPPTTTTTRPPTTTTTTTSATTTPTPTTTTTPPPPTSSPTSSQGGTPAGCASRPSACGYPDASNTGVPAGTTLVRVPEQVTSGPGWAWDPRGWISITGNGAVLDGILVNATIDVNTADNVTIRNSRIVTGGEGFGISLRHAGSVTIAASEIAAPAGNRLMVGIKDIYGDSASPTIRGNDISGTSTGVQVDQGLIQDNYIHDLGFISGDHVNGTTSNGGSQQLTIRHNTVFNQVGQTDAISLFQDFGAQANRIIDNNLVAGGGYTIYAGANPGKEASATNIQVTNNRIARVFFPNGGSYGPYTAYTSSGGNRFTGNVWDDTLVPLG